MHPSVKQARQLLPNPFDPEDISDGVDLCLRLRVADIFNVDQALKALDAVGEARVEVVEYRNAHAILIPQFKAECRRVEREFKLAKPQERPTNLERLVKTDERWIDLEGRAGMCQSIVDKCDSLEKILDSKYFILQMVLKEKLHG